MKISIYLRSMLLALMLLQSATCVLAQLPKRCPPVAQNPSSEQIVAGIQNGRDRGFLWRFSKDGHSSFLYGTLHVGKLEWLFPGPTLNEALGRSDKIVLELDLADPEILARLMKGAASLPGADPLPKTVTQRLQRLAKEECLASQALATVSPEMQVVMLTTLAGRRDGLDPAFAIDAFLAGLALGAKKTVVGLETPEQQFKAFLPNNAAERLEFVESGLSDLESGIARRLVKRLSHIWADGDLDALTGYMSWCDCVKTPADRAAMVKLIDERNPRMAAGVAALHESGKRVFAAVGSLHLVGPLGLPELLKQRGYQVNRIPLTR